jgi:hypothetical protein
MKHCPLLVLRYLFGMLNFLFGKRLRNFIGVGNNVVLTAKSSPHNHVQLQLYKCDYAAYLSYIFVCIHGMIIACVFNLDGLHTFCIFFLHSWNDNSLCV